MTRDVRVRRATDRSQVVMKSGLGTILALLLTTPAFAQAPSPASDQPFVIASGALVAAAMTDLTIGTYLIGAGRGREAGLGAGLEQHPVLFGVVKGSVMATEIALLRAVHRRHPRVALWMTVTVTSIEVAATWHNARLLNTR